MAADAGEPAPASMPAWRRLAGTAALLVLIGFIGALDTATGPLIGFSLFYLIPIVLAGWRLGSLPAVVVAVTAAWAWFLADVRWQQSSNFGISAWNGFTRLGMFLSIGMLTARVRADQVKTRALLVEARRLASTDGLTGLANSRCFFESLARRLGQATRGHSLSLVYVDVDNFKRINDAKGHAAGDEVLRGIAECLASPTRAGDVVARLGGDEFVLALFDREPDEVEEIVRRLISDTQDIGRMHPGSELSLSAGTVHASVSNLTDVGTLLHAADKAMYAVKSGRKTGSSRTGLP